MKRKYPFGLTKKTKKGYNFHWKRKIAKVSGGTLGFIAGDVPGAVLGWKGAGAAYKWKHRRDKAAKKAIKNLAKYKMARQKKTVTKVLKGHNDLSTTYAGTVNVTKKKFKRPSTIKWKYQNITDFVMNGGMGAMGVNGSTQGRQAVDVTESMVTGNWIRADTSTNRFERIKLASDFYKFADDYSYTYTGYSGEVAREYSTNNIYLDNIELQLGVLSMTTVPQMVDIYFITPTRDFDNGPILELGYASNISSDGMAVVDRATTIGDATVTDGETEMFDWGRNPFSISNFKGAWKCLKKVSLTLNPGDQHHLKFKFAYNTYLKQEYFINFRNRTYLKDLTVVPFFVARAGLVGLTSLEASESSEVAYGKAKVGISSNMTINFRGVKNPRLRPKDRIFRGMVESTTEFQREIDDNDNVVVPEVN